MDCLKVVYLAGQIIEIVGAVLLYSSAPIIKSGVWLSNSNLPTKKEKTKILIGRIGAGFVVFGGVIQIYYTIVNHGQ